MVCCIYTSKIMKTLKRENSRPKMIVNTYISTFSKNEKITNFYYFAMKKHEY